MNPDMVLLLGRKDEPTDAVQEYCQYLSTALGERSLKSEIARVSWNERGWSERGFPRRVLRVLRTLSDTGARVGVVFHDVEPFAGTRTVDVLRRQVQLRVMRRMLRSAELAVFTVSLDVVSWIKSTSEATFIPVGANLPETSSHVEETRDPGLTRIAVYGITGGTAGSEECSEIASALRFATERG